ncbi:MAG: HAD family phosphatase, partial [Alistipes dispar]
MEKIKNVVFDLGGVLVGLDFDRCTAAFRSLGMDAVAELINPCYPADMIGRLEHGDITFHEACDEMRRLSGTPKVTDDEIARAYGAFLTEIPVEKLRQIDRLRRRGFRTYVLSNNNPASME